MGIRAGGGLGYILMPALFSDIDLHTLNNEVNATISDVDLRVKVSQRFMIFQSTLAGVSSSLLLMLAFVYSQG